MADFQWASVRNYDITDQGGIATYTEESHQQCREGTGRYLVAGAANLSNVKPKSFSLFGLWHSKHALMLACSLRVPSGLNKAYSHSPLRISSGYSAPQPACFSITPIR